MSFVSKNKVICGLALPAFAVGIAEPGMSQTHDTFYASKEISFIVGYAPGASYDAYTRLAANHLAKHIPGNPAIVVRNMQGAGGLKAASHLGTQGARDGSVIGMVSQAVALEQVLGNPAARFDAGKFNWIGRITSAVEATLVWHTSLTKTIEDAKARETILAASAALGTAATNPRLMNNLAGTRFKIVTGYDGSAATMLAMEKGETEGAYTGLGTLITSKSDWIREKKINVLVQYSQKRHPKFPEVPAMVEFGQTTEDKQILAVYASTAEIGRSILAPPDVASDRIKILRRAFDSMMSDPVFLKDAASRQMEIDPLTGEELQKDITSLLSISAAVAKRAAAAREAN